MLHFKITFGYELNKHRRHPFFVDIYLGRGKYKFFCSNLHDKNTIHKLLLQNKLLTRIIIDEEK